MTGTCGISGVCPVGSSPFNYGLNTDATMNLHILLYGVRHGEVEQAIRIEH
jgi:hypothetical protein